MNKKIVVGIDEAGRGPLAGPVSVGTVIFYNLKVAHAFRGVRDSKKLSAEKREYWLSVMEREKKLGTIDFAVSLVSAQYIDTYGIVKAIQKGIRSNLKKLSIEPEYQITSYAFLYWLSVMEREKKLGTIDFTVSLVSAQYIDTYGIVKAIQKGIRSNLKKLSIEPEYQILLDGGLRAPNEFLNQKTIIKGDEKFRVISLASIVAKVHRDRKMVLCGKKYPKYGFEIHKGYGTLLHRNAIYKYGVSAVHRKSFLKNFVNK
jgi:ribonuclease HII